MQPQTTDEGWLFAWLLRNAGRAAGFRRELTASTVPKPQPDTEPEFGFNSLWELVGADEKAKYDADIDAASAATSNELQLIVDGLPDEQRRLLVTHVNDGPTYKEIATNFGLDPRYVLREVTAASARIRETAGLRCLGSEGSKS